MLQRLFRKSSKIGLPPGSLVYVGEKKLEQTTINIINYNQDNYSEKEIASIKEYYSEKKPLGVTWFNVEGLQRIEKIEEIGKTLNLHPLIMEDILNTQQRPKIDDYGEYIAITLRMLHRLKEGSIQSEQVSIVLGPDFVVSFQEDSDDVFNPIRDRIRSSRGMIRRMDADYLAYALIDTVVDNYFTVLEKLGDSLELLEEDLIENPVSETLQSLHSMKRDMVYLRKYIWPLRDIVSRLERSGTKLVKDTTNIYLRDLYDHTIQVIETIETYRDLLSGMMDLYLSSLSNKMNEVMKMLTIIGTIFIPLTFLTGIYGMNFKHMPELEYVWGYPALLVSMLIISIIMVSYFKRKEWL